MRSFILRPHAAHAAEGRTAAAPLPLPGSARGPAGRIAGLLRSRLAVAALGLALVACSEPMLAPPPDDAAQRAGAVKPWEANAAVYWNQVARARVIANRSSTPFAIRGYAIVSLAQHQAAAVAAKQKVGNVHPSIHAAIAAASVTVLTYLYPTEAATLESHLQAFLAGPAWPGEAHRSVRMGVMIGRAMGEQVVERAKTDRFFTPGTLTPPVGPGYWFSNTPPAGALFGQAKTFFLTSGDQFRPPPHPAFGSAAFNSALAEVRHYSDTRTPEQTANAAYWDGPAGTHTPPGIWNQEAAELAIKYHLDERKSAHLFALMNMVAYDAIVASHEAKYHYWLLRPTMADPQITVPIFLPNFPAYPSNHAAISAGMARIIADRIPAERARLDALAEEAALSRVLGGIHFRFDGEAGLALGRQVAAWALAHDVRGNEPFELP